LKIRVAWFGRPTADPYRSQVEIYQKRVRQRWPAEDRPLKPAAGGRGGDARRALRGEAEAVRALPAKGWLTVVLDEEGDSLTSADFAAMLRSAERSGTPGVSFIIGSDLGLDASLKAEAVRRISLTSMTLPHQLARLLLWEQLFRATHILGGGAYHRLSVQ
jgi:23S rRNA (pseudouridine1915-N3)-methyltransferase